MLGLSVAALKSRVANLDSFGLVCSDVATLQAVEAAAKKAEEERLAAERAAKMTQLIKSAHKKLTWDSTRVIAAATTLADGTPLASFSYLRHGSYRLWLLVSGDLTARRVTSYHGTVFSRETLSMPTYMEVEITTRESSWRYIVSGLVFVIIEIERFSVSLAAVVTWNLG